MTSTVVLQYWIGYRYRPISAALYWLSEYRLNLVSVHPYCIYKRFWRKKEKSDIKTLLNIFPSKVFAIYVVFIVDTGYCIWFLDMMEAKQKRSSASLLLVEIQTRYRCFCFKYLSNEVQVLHASIATYHAYVL